MACTPWSLRDNTSTPYHSSFLPAPDRNPCLNSWQHVTSVFIHLSPAVLTYGLRWHADPRFAVCADPPACGGPATAPGAMLSRALLRLYVPWLLAYYVWVFWLMGRRVKERGLQTLYDRVSSSGPLAPLLQTLETPALRKFLKVGDGVSGMVVLRSGCGGFGQRAAGVGRVKHGHDGVKDRSFGEAPPSLLVILVLDTRIPCLHQNPLV